LNAIAGQGGTQERAIRLLNWLSNGTHHKSDYDNHVERNALALLEYAFEQSSDKGLNCYNLSVILSEICLSVGIQARALWLYPKNPNDIDNHVVVMAWAPEKGKWLLLDPSNNSYFTNQAGDVLSPIELRGALANNDTGSITLNRESKNATESVLYMNYMAKNLFHFECIQKTKFGTFTKQRERIYFCPKDFDLADWMIKAFTYRHSFIGSPSEEQIAGLVSEVRNHKYIYATPDSFWGE
jgi:hypothetical protein